MNERRFLAGVYLRKDGGHVDGRRPGFLAMDAGAGPPCEIVVGGLRRCHLEFRADCFDMAHNAPYQL